MSRTQREKSQGKSRSAKLFGRNGKHFKRDGDDAGDASRRSANFLRSNRRPNHYLTEEFMV